MRSPPNPGASALIVLLAVVALACRAAAIERPPTAMPGDDGLPQPYIDANCTVGNVTQRIDHFNTSDARTFNQRVYVCDAYFPRTTAEAASNGSVIVFLGNESPLNNIVQPIVFENAARMRALIVEIEHRYYGRSIPFPLGANGMLPTEQYKYLTMEQVMADTKLVVETVRGSRGVPPRVPSLVIGGSYGGQLSSYHRLTYPDTFQAAIASSAPVDYVLGTQLLDRTVERFHEVLRRAYETLASPECATNIRTGMDQVAASRNGTVADRRSAALALGLCRADSVLDDPLTVQPLLGFLYDSFVGPAQLNDQKPYPGYIKSICSAVNESLANDPQNYLGALQAAYRLQNSSEPADCLDFVPENVVLPPPSADPIWPSYNYQSCAQGAVNSGELSTNGSTGLLPTYTLTVQDIRADCLRYFGPSFPPMTPLPVSLDFRNALARTGAVVFTNGDADHWSGGSISTAIPGVRMATVVYPNASHCTDTHTYNWNNTAEPPSYRQLRTQAMDAARVWMEEYRAKPSGAGAIGAGRLLGATVAAVAAVVMLGV
ncbi:serine carboxypeptidase S28-domain-containing protein [Hyaloraphidium curvatum]|nr:serine carboxypeptidase S28-domain-containing protein [Hyaloraphidium curvatum]